MRRELAPRGGPLVATADPYARTPQPTAATAGRRAAPQAPPATHPRCVLTFLKSMLCKVWRGAV